MKRSQAIPIAPGKTGAWVCLVAVVLLWAPLWAAAWHTEATSCCGKVCMCMAHRHAKPNAGRPQGAGAEQTPMGCEHHGGSGMSKCSMACCQESSLTLATPAIFVTPEPATIGQPRMSRTPAGDFAPMDFARSFAPPSPPPRTPVFSL